MKAIVRKLVQRILGPGLYEYVATIRNIRHRKRHDPPSTCPACGYVGWFRPYGSQMRAKALCPGCGGVERHRLFYLYAMQNGQNKLTGKSILHFAPEQFLIDLTKSSKEYITADIKAPDVDHHLDIISLPFEDARFDIVICNHVLEHVPDDYKALRELHRVLRTAGTAILTVPMIHEWADTYEDASITGPVARKAHFGEWDHLRYYGRDFVKRVERAGFSVETFQAQPSDCVKFSLIRGETIFIGKKA